MSALINEMYSQLDLSGFRYFIGEGRRLVITADENPGTVYVYADDSSPVARLEMTEYGESRYSVHFTEVFDGTYAENARRALDEVQDFLNDCGRRMFG